MAVAPQNGPAVGDPCPRQLGEKLKATTGRCLVCHRSCPGEVWSTGESPGRVFLKRSCPDHGEQWTLLSSDERFYWVSKGRAGSGKSGPTAPAACCSGGACENQRQGEMLEPADVIEKLSTCLALIEIVNSCNLKCPTCYADSPPGAGGAVDAVPLDEIKARVQSVIDRKGGIEILQLSGGEPTLHPEFCEILQWTNDHPGVDYVLVNTNGVRIATDDRFMDTLQEVVNRGHIQAYLQFDGFSELAQRQLRGADLGELKRRAVERCGSIGLPVTLAMTVVDENLGDLWRTIEFGLGSPHVRGVSFQPVFGSGRTGGADGGGQGRRPNVADIICAAVDQSGGRLKYEDFSPLPCGDPNCATIGYLLKVGDAVRSISDFVDFSTLQGFLADRVRYSLDDLERCGCESEPLGEILKKFELDASHTFRLFIKPFMDAHSWDDDRIDRCCTHVIRPDGRLDSFCRYYSGFADCGG